jgi:hypothetical protein
MSYAPGFEAARSTECHTATKSFVPRCSAPLGRNSASGPFSNDPARTFFAWSVRLVGKAASPRAGLNARCARSYFVNAAVWSGSYSAPSTSATTSSSTRRSRRRWVKSAAATAPAARRCAATEGRGLRAIQCNRKASDR